MAKEKKPTVKSVTETYMNWRRMALAYINEIRYPKSRKLLSVEAADQQGKLNGMTVVELITVAQLSANQGERVYLEVLDKTLTLVAEKDVRTSPPYELRS